MPLRFQEIRSTALGQRDAFEELVCQLARRHPPGDADEFRRVHGAGGDGGVECYWRLGNGAEVGYQAKYHLNSRDIDWAEIDKSVKTALTQHPRLTEYHVALACDPTDVTGGKGTKGWPLWDAHKARWDVEAKKRTGRSVRFVPWTASVLLGMLTDPSMSGLAAFWFDATRFTTEWFETRISGAIADLDERYHAEDHVGVGLELLFDYALHSDRGRKALRDELARVRERAEQHLNALATAPLGRAAELQRAMASVDALLDVARDLDTPPFASWEATRWVALGKLAQGHVSLLSTAVHDDAHASAAAGSPGINVQKMVRGFGALVSAIERLVRLLSTPAFRAETERAILLQGTGGTGKSHLCAREAELALTEGRPVVLVLGQQLRTGAIWPQVLQRLGVQGSHETLLQALDSAAEACNKRALFMVDALNEGAGPTQWRDELASFVEVFRPYRNVVCVLSCRSEYVPYVVTHTAGRNLVPIEVRGFVTEREQQQAACVYMDRKGIARPSSPWLAEEFTNPLFLRSVCVSLQKDGKHAFPRGLAGIKKILALYVTSVARHLVPSYDGSSELVAPTRATLLAVARAMAAVRRDFLTREAAGAIAQEKFTAFAAPTGRTWLEVLQRSGLFRFDINPDIDPDVGDPSPSEVEVVRFSFQRFQDHLISEALLQGVSDIREALSPGGALEFVARQRWVQAAAGVASALITQVPEIFGQELVDVWPGGFASVKDREDLRQAFIESLRLRSAESFSLRTTELFEEWLTDRSDSMTLLLQLAVAPDHPWNADGMHARLRDLSMGERDKRWSVALSSIDPDDVDHAVFRLCAWCSSSDATTAIDRTRELTALALGWCLSSSNRAVRDRATKALSRLMLVQASLLEYLVERLGEVNDLYVSERLWAAAYGACTQDQSLSRLTVYAKTAWRRVFDRARVPDNLLLRDYARAIVELAASHGVDLTGIDVARCRPPHVGPAIALEQVVVPDHDAVKVLGDGAASILSSCILGDFGDYDIRPAVREITTTLTADLPVFTKASAFRAFRSAVLDGSPGKEIAFRRLEEHLRMMRMPRLASRDEGGASILFERSEPTAKQIRRADSLEQAFLKLLDAREVASYRKGGEPWLTDSFDAPRERVDAERCRAWVARRAVEMAGPALEAADPVSGYGSERPTVERLGKKYQWLALSELLCALTAANCLEVGYAEGRDLVPYDLPQDLGLVRDIDPTVLFYAAGSTLGVGEAWMPGPPIVLDEVPEVELSAWPAKADPADDLELKVVRTDPEGRRWLTLYDHVGSTSRYEDSQAEHGMRHEEFRRIFSVFVETPCVSEFVSFMDKERRVDVSNWELVQLTDEPFLGEAVWRSTWPQEQWSERSAQMPERVRLAFPLCEYVWESHLDLSLTEGARAYVPAPWLARKLNLVMRPTFDNTVSDLNGQSLFRRATHDRGSVALLHEDALQTLQRDTGLTCVFLLVAERNAWPGGSNAHATWRRAEGLAWIESRKVRSITWTRDGSAKEVTSRTTYHLARKKGPSQQSTGSRPSAPARRKPGGK